MWKPILTAKLPRTTRRSAYGTRTIPPQHAAGSFGSGAGHARPTESRVSSATRRQTRGAGIPARHGPLARRNARPTGLPIYMRLSTWQRGGGSPRVKVLHIDCFAGIAGDMLLGALIDAGASAQEVRDGLAGLPVTGWELRTERVIKQGISATQVSVSAAPGATVPGRMSYAELTGAMRAGGLSAQVTERSLAVLSAIAEAEARVHGVTVDEVHFHEIGGLDTLVDVTGAALALELLGIERVTSAAI
ncbi:MAG: LarC family nickel insertion protein, partial [Armatimonadetes bacterium]|nr:LarC family nickel insertion protein [Armatimonadota bacterium]